MDQNGLQAMDIDWNLCIAERAYIQKLSLASIWIINANLQTILILRTFAINLLLTVCSLGRDSDKMR